MLSSPAIRRASAGGEERLEPFVISVPTISPRIQGREVKQIFDGQPELEGLVVLEGDVPVGIIMRILFYQKLSSLYGNSLFLERDISILMDADMLVVDMEDSVSHISISAMNRSQGQLYDYIVVTRQQRYAGVISIRQFLVELSRRNEAQIQLLHTQQERLLEQNRQEQALKYKLMEQSQTIKNLLDHAGQGFMLFDRSLLIGQEYSAECVRIFGKKIGGLHYIQLIENALGSGQISVFDAALAGYFASPSPVLGGVYLSLLPSEAAIEGKSIHFEYKPIENGEQKAVMVILNDISDRKALEKAMQEERNTQRLLFKALTCREQIRETLRDFREQFAQGGPCRRPDKAESIRQFYARLYRAVHTYKGDFSQNGFLRTAHRLHTLENSLTRLAGEPQGATTAGLEALLEDFDAQAACREDVRHITSLLGAGYFEGEAVLTIPEERLQLLKRQLLGGPEQLDREQVARMLAGLRHKSLRESLLAYQDTLAYLAQRLNKPVPVYVVEGEDVYLDPGEYGELLRSLIHLYRNMMDHGLEAEEERLGCSKPAQGVVLCRIALAENNRFTLSFSDDGRGIDLKRVSQKALDARLCSEDQIKAMSRQELLDLVLSDGFSTKESADDLSGRGMGLAAVRAACERLRGRLLVASQEGRGTTFTMELPLGIH